MLGHPKLKRAMADADRAGAGRIWLIGPDEIQRGVRKEPSLFVKAEKKSKTTEVKL